MTGGLTRRPVDGRLVTRQYHYHHRTVRCHAAVLFEGVILTRCGLTRPAEPHRRRIFVRSTWLPINCQHCLATL